MEKLEKQDFIRLGGAVDAPFVEGRHREKGDRFVVTALSTVYGRSDGVDTVPEAVAAFADLLEDGWKVAVWDRDAGVGWIADSESSQAKVGRLRARVATDELARSARDRARTEEVSLAQVGARDAIAMRAILRWVGGVHGQPRPPMSEQFAALLEDGLIVKSDPGAWVPMDAYSLTPLGVRVLGAILVAGDSVGRPPVERVEAQVERVEAERVEARVEAQVERVDRWSRCPACGSMAQMNGLDTCGCEAVAD